MDISVAGLFVVGLVLLTYGADVLVKGASQMALALGISPLVIGLTVVAFGTSAPEMAVSTVSAWEGTPDIAIGNVVGSNIFNVLFILGVSALLVPLVVSQQLVRLDVPIMIGASLLVMVMALDGNISRLDGALLFAGIIAYTSFLIIKSRRESQAIRQEYTDNVTETVDGAATSWLKSAALVIAGLVMLVLGSRWLVNGAVEFARMFGVSELVIGLTIVAAGTSLPEVATSVMASLRNERDIAVGNVVGSNIFNLLAVLGMAGLVAPAGVPVSATALQFDLPIMVAVAVACLPVFFAGHIISRWNGALFLGYYVVYTSYLILIALEHSLVPTMNTVMLGFVIPLTVIALATGVVAELRSRKRG